MSETQTELIFKHHYAQWENNDQMKKYLWWQLREIKFVGFIQSIVVNQKQAQI